MVIQCQLAFVALAVAHRVPSTRTDHPQIRCSVCTRCTDVLPPSFCLPSDQTVMPTAPATIIQPLFSAHTQTSADIHLPAEMFDRQFDTTLYPVVYIEYIV